MSQRSPVAAERNEAGPQLVQPLSLSRGAAEGSPMPTAELEGTTYIIRYANPAFCLLSNRTKEELIGTDFRTVGPATEECIFLIGRVHRTGKPHTHIGREHSGPEPFYWSYAVWPAFSADNRVTGAMIQVTETTAFHQDAIAMNQALIIGSVRQHELTEAAELLTCQLQAEIAAREKAERALIASEKLASVGRMSAVLAHEINNPIAAVMDMLYLIKDVAGLPDPVPEYLEMADGELKRIAHITRQTLGFCTDISTPTTFRMCALLESVKDMLKAKIKSKNAFVNLRCDTQMEIAAMDGELRQVFSNFVLNSLHAIDPGGKVTLRASPSRNPISGDRRIRITVSDNGSGISEATLPQIFEPFFTTKGAVGNGLGLWVSKQIIDKHGGSLRVRSCTEGARRGTSFSVVLPGFVAQPISKLTPCASGSSVP